MSRQRLAGRYGQAIALDLCFACGVLWFDHYESLLLAPSAILRLFTTLHERRGDRQNAVIDRPACVRCGARLVHTIDRQRHVRFSYWRCPREHGRLTSFVEFLREKDFVRPLAPAELSALRARVQVVRCDGCGAPVDIARSSTCSYCGAAVSVLDPAHVERVVAELQAAEGKRRTECASPTGGLGTDRLDLESFLRRIQGDAGPDGGVTSLVDASLAAVAAFLASPA